MMILIQSGVLMMLFGMFYGVTLNDSPYPIMAAGTHEQFMINGLFIVLMGVLLETGLSSVEGWKGNVLFIGWVPLMWVMLLSEMLGASYGCKEFLKISASRAGAPGCAAPLENAIAVAHVMTTLFFVPGTVFVLIGTRNRVNKKKE